MSVTRTALLKLDFLIVGGGIAGLGTAFELARAGHRVRVLERAPGLGQKAGGLRIPPNLSQIFVKWGLEDALKACAVRCTGSPFLSLETGERIGWLAWDDDVMKETGGSFWLVHHEDLHRMMYELAASEGASVEFGVDVVSVRAGEEGEDEDADERPYVKLGSGEIIYADIIVGSDGSESIVRPVVQGGESDGESTGTNVYTATIPVSAMMADPELAELARKPEWTIWMGDGRNILGYPIRPGQEYAVHLCWPDKDGNAPEGWGQEVQAVDISFEGYDLRFQKLMSLVQTVFKIRYQKREVAEEWVDESGRIVLIGEAAHPMMPCSTQGCSLALEDAAVFGTLFSRLSSWDQVGQLLDAFVELRQARCIDVSTREEANKNLMEFPPGPIRDGRDATMRQAMAAREHGWDETELRRQLDQIAAVFAYNAFDAADDWYVSWGALREVSMQRRAYGEGFDLSMGITHVHTVEV